MSLDEQIAAAERMLENANNAMQAVDSTTAREALEVTNDCINDVLNILQDMAIELENLNLKQSPPS